MGFSASRAVCALVFVASTMMTPSVLAHAHLNQQVPAADSVVTAPQALTLNFSEGIEPGHLHRPVYLSGEDPPLTLFYHGGVPAQGHQLRPRQVFLPAQRHRGKTTSFILHQP